MQNLRSRLVAKLNDPDYYYFLVIFFYPLLLLMVNENLFFPDFFGRVTDPWVYTGYFFDLTHFFINQHIVPYHSSRLSWILPGYFVNKILPPVTANYLLHFVFMYAAMFSLYFILKEKAGQRAGLLATLMMGGYSYFLLEIGSNYVCGAGLTYFLLSAAMAVAGLKKSPGSVYFFASGIFFACMVYANTFTLSLLPFLVLYYIAFSAARDAATRCTDVGFFTSGIVILTFLFCVLNYFISGSFLFFMPQIIKMLSTVGEGGQIWQPANSWLDHAYWLIFPVIVLPVSFFFCIIKKGTFSDRTALLCNINFILYFFFLVFLQMSGLSVMQNPFYFAYVIPFSFIAIGCMVKPFTEGLSIKQFLCVIGIFVACILAAMSLFQNGAYDSPVVKEQWLKIFAFCFFFLLTGFIVLNYFHILRKTAITLSFVIMLMCYSGFSSISYLLVNPAESDNDFQKNTYRGFTAAFQEMRKIAPRGDIKIWYASRRAENNINSTLFKNIIAAYGMNHCVIGDDFPLTSVKEYGIANNLRRGEKIVVLSTDLNSTYQQALSSLKEAGVDATLLSRKEIFEGNVHFSMIFFRIMSDYNYRRYLAGNYCYPLFESGAGNLIGHFTDRYVDKLLRMLSSKGIVGIRITPDYEKIIRFLSASGINSKASLTVDHDGSISFTPLGIVDDIRTQPIVIVPASRGGGDWLRIRMQFNINKKPGHNCILYLKDNHDIEFKTIYFDEPDSGQDIIEYVKMPEDITSFRLFITTADAKATYIPIYIRIDQMSHSSGAAHCPPRLARDYYL